MVETPGIPRIEPLSPPYPPDIGETLAKWMPPGGEAEPLALFRTLIVHPQLMSRMRPLGAGILGSGALVPPALREVVIHRTCALTGAEYEWGVHAVAFGRPLGLDEEQLRSTVHGGSVDRCWNREQACVFALADQLHHTSAISDQLWLELCEHSCDAPIIELIATAGWYHLIAYVCNAARVPREEWAARFPQAAAEPSSAR